MTTKKVEKEMANQQMHDVRSDNEINKLDHNWCETGKEEFQSVGNEDPVPKVTRNNNEHEERDELLEGMSLIDEITVTRGNVIGYTTDELIKLTPSIPDEGMDIDKPSTSNIQDANVTRR